MRVRDDSLLRVAFALRDPKTAPAAVRELAGNPDPIAVDGLLERVEASPSSRLVVSALESLEPSGHAHFREAVRLAFGSPHDPVRLAAVLAVQRGKFDEFNVELGHVIRTDESWPTRRAAVQTLAEREPAKWGILAATDDPHWRVRHALIRVLQTWGMTEADRAEIRGRLTPSPLRGEGTKSVRREFARILIGRGPAPNHLPSPRPIPPRCVRSGTGIRPFSPRSCSASARRAAKPRSTRCHSWRGTPTSESGSRQWKRFASSANPDTSRKQSGISATHAPAPRRGHGCSTGWRRNSLND